MSGSTTKDIRASTLPRRLSTNGVIPIGTIAAGQFVGIDPAAFFPTASQIGAATESAVTTALAGKENVAAKGNANGYAPLDGNGKVPAGNLPTASGGAGAIVSNATPQGLGATSVAGSSPDAARADHIHARPTPADIGAANVTHTHTIAAVTGLQGSLDGKENLAAKGLANGYAPLGTDAKVPAAYLPAGISQTDLNAKADAATVNTALALKADAVATNTALANKVGVGDSRYLNAVQPDYLAQIDNFTTSLSLSQGDVNRIKRYTLSTTVNQPLPALSVGSTIRFIQSGTGPIQFTPGTNQTINSFGNLVTTAGQHANVVATVIAANTWNLSGNLV